MVPHPLPPSIAFWQGAARCHVLRIAFSSRGPGRDVPSRTAALHTHDTHIQTCRAALFLLLPDGEKDKVTR